MEQSIWIKAKCRAAKFANCNLTYADFTHADLSLANLGGAKMYRTRLHRALLSDTNMPIGAGAALGDEPLLAEAEDWWEQHRPDRR